MKSCYHLVDGRLARPPAGGLVESSTERVTKSCLSGEIVLDYVYSSVLLC